MPLTLESTITVGEPDVCGPLAVFPLSGPEPRLEYLSFAEAAARGATVTELPHGASVNDVLVHNPLPIAFLLYEGEELRGAQQDRTVDAAVLVPAGETIQVAVSCVERGRWDGSRSGEAFSPSPQAAFPSLRAARSQDQVWATVAARSAELDAASETGAMGDAFEHRRHDVEALRAAIPRRPGQVGAIAAIGGELVVMDMVSRADVWAALHAPLVSGYALEAIDRDASPAPETAEAAARVALMMEAGFEPAPGNGMGERFRGGRATALRCEGELIQLSAFFS